MKLFFLIITFTLLSCQKKTPQESSEVKVAPVAVAAALAVPAGIKTAAVATAWVVGSGTIIYLSNQSEVLGQVSLPSNYITRETANLFNTELHQPITGPSGNISRIGRGIANAFRKKIRNRIGSVPSVLAAQSLTGMYDTMRNLNNAYRSNYLTQEYYNANAEALGNMGYERFKAVAQQVMNVTNFSVGAATSSAWQTLNQVKDKVGNKLRGNKCVVATVQSKCNGNVRTVLAAPAVSGMDASVIALGMKALVLAKCGAELAGHLPFAPNLAPVKVKGKDASKTIKNLCVTAASSVKADEPKDGVLRGSGGNIISIIQSTLTKVAPVIDAHGVPFSKSLHLTRAGAYLGLAAWACHHPVVTVLDGPCNYGNIFGSNLTSTELNPVSEHDIEHYRCVTNQEIVPHGARNFTSCRQ